MTMNTYRNYKHLSQQIHAPEALKNRVMTIAAQENLTKQNQPASRRHQSFGFFQKAAVAALLAIVLPVTAFAAAKKMGLLEYLSLAGLQDTPALEELSYNVMEKQAYRNTYAEYTVNMNYPLPPKFIRVLMVDENGKRAWSNPVELKR